MKSLLIALIAAKKEKENKGWVETKQLVKASIVLPVSWRGRFYLQSNFYWPQDEMDQKRTGAKVEDENTVENKDDCMDTGEKEGTKIINAETGVHYATNFYMETILEGVKLFQKCLKN